MTKIATYSTIVWQGHLRIPKMEDWRINGGVKRKYKFKNLLEASLFRHQWSGFLLYNNQFDINVYI